MTTLTGIVLAAGAGSRLGLPKALMRTADGQPWVARAADLLRAAGCDPVLVMLGAAAAEAAALVPADTHILVVESWEEGIAASLRAGLEAAEGTAALITLVDLPDLPAEVVARVLDPPVEHGTLRRAVFDGSPGHPVLLGRDHWAELAGTLVGDQGARAYLNGHGVIEVECGDLFDGHDIDQISSTDLPGTPGR